MSEQQPSQVLRSIGAVVAGIVVGLILTIATDIVLFKAGVFPPIGQPASSSSLLLATIYRTVYGVLGSYVIARLAPSAPMKHALVSGAIGVVVSTVGAVVTWNKATFGPHWYPVTLIVLSMPSAWAGAKIREAQITKAQQMSAKMS
ncbi:MAG TPA: hypothetical protein VG498_20635 [Terriglobales bacterium]|nr:hypothetical protein [Terriglobales bacterium]